MADIARRTVLSLATSAVAAAGTATAGAPRRFLVLGAGFAGLSAAQTLKAAGHSVVVLEARDRAGGRAWTRPIGRAHADVGASWLHEGYENPLRPVALKGGVEIHESDYWNLDVQEKPGAETIAVRNLFRRSNAEQALDELVRRELADLPDPVPLPRAKSVPSLAAVWPEFERRVHDPAATGFIRNVLEMRLALPISRASVLAARTASELPQDEQFLPVGEALVTGGMQNLAHLLTKGLDIRFRHEVRAVRWSERRVVAVTSAGEFTADAAVVTFPVGVLKARPELFDPPLPAEHRAALARLDMGLLGKIALAFDEVSWPVDRQYYCHSADEGLVHCTVNVAASNGAPVLMGLANGRASHVLEGLTDAEAARQYRAQMELVFRRKLPPPVGVAVSRWSTDPYALGSYAASVVGVTGGEAETLSRPIGNTLVLAGEAYTVTDAHTVHGAAASGRRAAHHVMGVPA